MNKAITLALAVTMAGCATHAKIDTPVVEHVSKSEWASKTFSYKVLYSQPEPGMFNDGVQQPYQPLKESKLSLASATVLQKLPGYLEDQLPRGIKVVQEGDTDYQLEIRLKANHKRGPSYSDYAVGSSFAKSIVTLGFGASDYEIIADFDADYILTSKTGGQFSKHFSVKETVDHQRGRFESLSSTNDYAADLLRKHMMLTMSTFLKEAAGKVN